MDETPLNLAALEFVRASQYTRRFHICQVLHEETTAQHSYNVAWLCRLIWGSDISASLLLAALEHDMAEHVTGDMPAHTKRNLGLGALMARHEEKLMADVGLGVIITKQEAHVLKIADALDGLLYCANERRLGNTTLDVVWSNYTAYVGALQPTGRALEIFNYAKEQYERQ